MGEVASSNLVVPTIYLLSNFSHLQVNPFVCFELDLTEARARHQRSRRFPENGLSKESPWDQVLIVDDPAPAFRPASVSTIHPEHSVSQQGDPKLINSYHLLPYPTHS